MPKYVNGEYDIEKAFRAIEDELIGSMIRNLDGHRAEETEEGYNWSQWQVDQINSLEKYKHENEDRFTSTFSDIHSSIGAMISEARAAGGTDQEQKILRAIKNGFKTAKKPEQGIEAAFFRLNTRKLEALVKATTDDFTKAEHAMLRMSNDKYRQIIFNAQVYANTGAATYEKAVDMATRDFLSSGINCVEYKNGARHTLKEYSQMAIQTANKRAYLTGEGEKRQEYGISTVIMNKRGNACPKCLPFVGKILIDDVWSGGKAEDGPYPLMSTAIEAGLFHPRCKDSHTTYFPELDKSPKEKYTKEELKQVEKDYKADQEQQYAERQAEKYDRLSKYSLDPENKKIYGARADEWSKRANKLIYDDSQVYYDQNNDYTINIPTYDDKVNKGISCAIEDVATKGNKDRCEHMHLIDLSTGNDDYYETNGDTGSVGIEFWNYIKEHKNQKFAFIHNHNITSSLSQADLMTSATQQNVPVMIAVQNNGVKYYVERTKDAVDIGYPDIYYENELKELNEKSRSGRITPTERMQQREQIIIDCLYRDFFEKGMVIVDGRKIK